MTLAAGRIALLRSTTSRSGFSTRVISGLIGRVVTISIAGPSGSGTIATERTSAGGAWTSSIGGNDVWATANATASRAMTANLPARDCIVYWNDITALERSEAGQEPLVESVKTGAPGYDCACVKFDYRERVGENR